MDDQVASLRAMGVQAVAMHSGSPDSERGELEALLTDADVPLVFAAPERAVRPGFARMLARRGVRSLCIDEAHCISQWGHDFRPEYRRLAELRGAFPEAAVHAFTATATPTVGDDIVGQLGMRDPLRLIGPVHRPNLLIRTRHRTDGLQQCLEVIRRHEGEAGIVYCLSRADAERTHEGLQKAGVKAGLYHAGLSAESRRRAHERFRTERLDVMVATVAFGMGIDRGDVRFVVHLSLPRSVEHWVQESGRAGRDGLPSEVVLLHGSADMARWQRLIDRSASEADAEGLVDRVAAEAHRQAQLAQVAQMRSLAATHECRHGAIATHFGQAAPAIPCGGCEICLGEWQPLADATRTARVALSAVARCEQRFGIGHVSSVLAGASTKPIARWGHDRLSVHGMLRHLPRTTIALVLEQLLEQGLVGRTDGDHPTLHLTPEAMPVLRGEREIALHAPPAPARRTASDAAAWGDLDRTLVDRLRAVRRTLAGERGIAPFMVFSDVTLRELARRRPATTAELWKVPGLGERRIAAYGAALLEAVGA
jgi:ATP-dependent DNA helicase RecQ